MSDQKPSSSNPELELLREQNATLSALLQQQGLLLERLVEDREAQKKAEERIAEREPLPTTASERQRITAFWDSEPRVRISISPTEDDQKAAKAMRTREFPPRLFQVNGVQIALQVGKVIEVPQSIAELHEYTLDPWSARSDPKPITFEEAELRLD